MDIGRRWEDADEGKEREIAQKEAQNWPNGAGGFETQEQRRGRRNEEVVRRREEGGEKKKKKLSGKLDCERT